MINGVRQFNENVVQHCLKCSAEVRAFVHNSLLWQVHHVHQPAS
jgi:hypothetical protein